MSASATPTPRRRATAPCLVIEDSAFDQKRIARAVSHGCRGLELVFTETIEGARDKLAKDSFSMILLDNNLPDGTGADFAVELLSLIHI